MSEEASTSTVERFMLDRVETHEELQVLMRLSAHPDDLVTARSLASELQLPETEVEESLAQLVRRELVAQLVGSPSRFRYEPARPELRASVEALTRLYARDRFGVFQTLSANALRRLRATALRTFADCFRLGGTKKDG